MIEPLDTIDEGALQIMRSRGEGWHAYQNQDLNHPDRGRLTFLRCGPGCTYAKPPSHAPDSPAIGLGWRYRLVGKVDLELGKVIPQI